MIKKTKKNYPVLTEHFKNSKEVLVLKELRLMQKTEDMRLIHELKNLGEICLPLFNPSHELLGFFTLGKKKFDDPYFFEEIEAIRQINFYFNLELTSILYKSELKREVSQKTKKLKEMIQQQSDFIAVSAHELRTPLNIALLQAESMEDFLQNPQQEKNFVRMSDALKKLEVLTNELFDVQKHDLNKVNLQTQNVDIGKFFSDIHINFLPLMRSKSIDFRYENKLHEDVKIKIDSEQIQQATQNLLNNAVKFTPNKGKVTLCVSEFGNEIQICVSDSGEGIPDKMKKVVFNKFRSNHAVNGKGIGLGLYLCKKIIQLHEGKVWVQDAVGGGAEFCIRLAR